MKTRGMQLYINRNTKTAKGFFVLKEISENNRVNKDKEEKYEVKMVEEIKLFLLNKLMTRK